MSFIGEEADKWLDSVKKSYVLSNGGMSPEIEVLSDTKLVVLSRRHLVLAVVPIPNTIADPRPGPVALALQSTLTNMYRPYNVVMAQDRAARNAPPPPPPPVVDANEGDEAELEELEVVVDEVVDEDARSSSVAGDEEDEAATANDDLVARSNDEEEASDSNDDAVLEQDSVEEEEDVALSNDDEDAFSNAEEVALSNDEEAALSNDEEAVLDVVDETLAEGEDSEHETNGLPSNNNDAALPELAEDAEGAARLGKVDEASEEEQTDSALDLSSRENEQEEVSDSSSNLSNNESKEESGGDNLLEDEQEDVTGKKHSDTAAILGSAEAKEKAEDTIYADDEEEGVQDDMDVDDGMTMDAKKNQATETADTEMDLEEGLSKSPNDSAGRKRSLSEDRPAEVTPPSPAKRAKTGAHISSLVAINLEESAGSLGGSSISESDSSVMAGVKFLLPLRPNRTLILL